MKVFGDPTAFKAFSEPDQSSDSFAMADHLGKGALITVRGIEEVETKSYGTKPAARIDVTVLGPKGNETFSDALVFNAAVIGQLKDAGKGEVILADIVSYQSKFGRPGYKFAPPSPATLALAEKAPF